MQRIILAAAVALFPLAASADTSFFGSKTFLENLTRKLGTDWNVDSSGGRIVATKKEAAETKKLDAEKATKECREIMDEHKRITVSQQGNTVKITGRSDDCNDLAGDINDVAKVNGITRLEVSVICDEKK